jgi:hypothetical protein
MSNTYDHPVSYIDISCGPNAEILSESHLGFMRCAIVKATPSRIHKPPTTTYAIPRNGFRPPITVRVEITMDLVPPYSVALKSNVGQL